MKTFKKIIAFTLAAVMVAGISVGATVAYLKDEDSDVNVMTLGNVQIEQHELQRTDAFIENAGHKGTLKTGDLEEFEQNQALYPAVPKNGLATDYSAEATDLLYWGPYVTAEGAGNGLWNDAKLSNVMDKMVFVENTGKSDAYYRTLIAFECPDGITIGEPAQGAEIMINVNGNTRFTWEEVCYITVDDVQYCVMSATYNEVLKPTEISRPSLLQVVMTHNATNEDMEKLGETYEILVLSQAVQTAGFADAKTALETAFPFDGAELASWFGDVIDEAATGDWDIWDGTADKSWYNDSDTEFTLTTAEQLAGLAELVDGGNTFEGKTIKLAINMDLRARENGVKEGEIILQYPDNPEDKDPLSFEPIGSYEYDKCFKGTFDGQNFTIANMYQNGWALENGLRNGDDLGLGLFGKVRNSTVKNLKIDNASQPTQYNLNGFVAGAAYGNCLFENITVTNSYTGNHSYYSGGIVGWASGDHKYINCDLDDTNVISSQWGDFNNANGGIIGGAGASGTYHFEDCDIACVIDGYNDYTSAYEWGAYRNCGMLIGNTNHTTTDDAVTTAAAPNVTCKNVTVTYGDWANYHYCEFRTAGYPWCRVEAGESTGAYGNARVGQYFDADGNKVVDSNHTHIEGEDGEGHNKLMTFDQLFGGPGGDRYCTYGTATHDGVTVIYNN